MANVKLKIARVKKLLSQAEVAEAAGITQQAYSLIERGLVTPRAKTAKKLEEVLGVRVKGTSIKG